MFGYVVANPAALCEEDKLAYRACYCGVCRALQTRHGAAARAALTYDMAFLALLLSSARGEPFSRREARCAVHPAKEHAELSNQYTDYAADMNAILAYYKALDDWRDDKRLSMLGAAQLLKAPAMKAEAAWARQASAIRESLAELSALEKAGEPSPDQPARAFGRMMGELFAYDEGDQDLRAFGEALGRFVYLMDAAVDLRGDIKRERYNPLVSLGREGIRDCLDAVMAECLERYRALPVTAYAAIFENILYSGVWTRYETTRAKRGTNQG